MIVGQRIVARLPVVGISQAELARRVPMSQSAMNNLIAGRSRSSTHLHKIARELLTTPAYLTGEIDDPDLGAPYLSSAPRLQLVTAKIALPSEAALEAAYCGLLRASRGMDEAELARELAKRLPTILRVAGDEIVDPSSAAPAVHDEAQAVPAVARPAARRAARS